MLLDNPFAPLGFLGDGSPVYPLAGAEPQEGEIEVDPDEGAEPDLGSDPEEGTEPESDDDEKTRLRAALKKANGEAASFRRQLKEAKKQAAEAATEEVEEETAATGTELTPAQLKRAVDKAVKAATEAAETKYRKVAVHAAAESALVKAKVKSTAVDKLVRLLDVDDVEIDPETGRVVAGLDEQIDTLKDDFPELFAAEEAPKQPKRPAPKKAAAAPRQEAEPQPLSSAEKIAAQLLGTGR